MEFGFKWPKRFTSRHISQLIFAKRAGTLAEVLAEILEQNGASCTLQEMYSFLEEVEETCTDSGVYVLDGSSHPEAWCPPALPRVIKTSVYFSDPDLHNTPRLLRRYQGKGLPEGLSEDERSQALVALRQQPIYYQPCRGENCNEEVLVTLGQAGRSIEKFGLSSDNPYQPSTRCRDCRAKYEALKGTRRSEEPAQPRKKSKRKGMATLGEVVAAHVPEDTQKEVS